MERNDDRVERLDRRGFGRLVARSGMGLAAWAGLVGPLTIASPGVARAAGKRPWSTGHLDGSPFVYISPLRSNGSESTCHAELWYAWLDERIVVIVSKTGWKAQAVSRGLDRAHVWVGAYGRWKNWYGGTNDTFLSSPRAVARVERSQDAALLDRLLARYEKKYPEEIADWRDPMRKGFADGSRVLLTYEILESSA